MLYPIAKTHTGKSPENGCTSAFPAKRFVIPHLPLEQEKTLINGAFSFLLIISYLAVFVFVMCWVLTLYRG